MGEDRGAVRPLYFGAGRDVALKVVGMQLNQSRCEVVTAAIHRTTRHGCASVDCTDLAVAQGQAACHHLIPKDQLGVGEDRFMCHVPVTSN